MQRTLILDGLRGIAVLAVVIEHAWPGLLPGGFAGVDVFFVLSGYLITGLLVRELERTGTVDLVAFYARRIRRILPASLIAVAATVLLYLAVFGLATPKALRWEALSAALSYSNVLFLGRTVDYFAAAPSTSPFLHFWSLAVEEQFYLVWPGLLLALTVAGRRIGGVAASRLVPFSVLGLGVVSLGLAVWASQSFAFYMLPARAWELAVGGGLVILETRGRLRIPDGLGWLRLVGAAAGFAMLGLCFVAAPELGRWPGPATLLPVIGTALLVAGGDGVVGGWLLRVAPLRFLGRISYALYLWHWPILAIAALVALPVIPLPAEYALVAVGVAGVAATVSTILVEEPIRASRARFAVGRYAVVGGLATALVVGGSSFATIRFGPELVDAGDPIRAAVLDARSDNERVIADGCVTRLADAAIRSCVYGIAARPDGGPQTDVPVGVPVVVLFGDSHASHWFPAIDAWARERGFALVPILRSACPPVDAPIPSRNQDSEDCDAFRAAALARIAELRPALTIVSGSLGSGIIVDGEVRNPRRDFDLWVEPSARMLRAVADRSAAVVLIGDVPRPDFWVTDCIGAHSAEPGRCDRPLESVQPAALRAAEARAAEAARVAFIDPTDWLCGESCTWIVDGRLSFRDPQHLSTAGAMAALPVLSLALDGILGASADG